MAPSQFQGDIFFFACSLPSVDSFRSSVTEFRKALLEIRLVGTRARLRHIAVLGCILLGMLLAWIGMQFQGTPEPSLPIEHVNLLAAETFASGRLSNPAHPAGFFLQTYLTLQSPTYAAAVPPGPGLLLASGVVLGDPLYALWISAGLFAGVSTWMLLGFTSLRWAVLGGMLTALWFGTLTFWGQSFATPIATGIGAALIWGATRRYAANPHWKHATLAGLGMGWLWLCNPMAFFFTLPVPLFLLGRAWCRHWNPRHFGFLSIGLVGAFAFQASYNQSITGSAWTNPVALYEQHYNVHPKFIWELPKIHPHYDFWRMEQYDIKVHEIASRLNVPAGGVWLGRLEEIGLFYIGLPGAILLASGLMLGASRWARVAAMAAGLSLLPVILVPPITTGMTAPLAPVAIILIVWSARRVWTQRTINKLDCGRLTWIFAASFFVVTWYRGFGFTIPAEVTQHRAHQTSVLKHLHESAGPDLVVVKYAIEAEPHVEYVYNGGDVDAQDIVWARWHETADMTPLFEHFKNRTCWMLTVIPGAEPELRPFKWVPRSQTPPSTP